MKPGSVLLPFGDGEHPVRLPMAQLYELDEKTEAGPLELYQRITEGKWKVRDLRETIRLALIGGGMKPAQALSLVKRYVEERPLMESVEPARIILMYALTGPPDLKGKAGRRGQQKAPPADSPSPRS